MLGRASWRALALVIWMVAGCAHLRQFRCPARGGPEWREVRSKHFVLRTDLSSAKAQELVRELEAMHKLITGALIGPTVDVPSVIAVLALRSDEEFRELAPPGARKKGANEWVAAYFTFSAFLEPTIVMPGELGHAQRQVLAHEITHDITFRALPQSPRWFIEGLAAYMETIGDHGPGRVPTVGGLPSHYFNMVSPYFGKVREIIAPGAPVNTFERYAVAWALVHFLTNERSAAFVDLKRRYARGENPAAAWRAVASPTTGCKSTASMRSRSASCRRRRRTTCGSCTG